MRHLNRCLAEVMEEPMRMLEGRELQPEGQSGRCPGGLGLLDLFWEEQEGQDVRAEKMRQGWLEEEKL